MPIATKTLVKAVSDTVLRQKAIKDEQDYIRQKAQKFFVGNTELEEKTSKILKDLDDDLIQSKYNNLSIDEYTDRIKSEFDITILYNKMELVLGGGARIVRDLLNSIIEDGSSIDNSLKYPNLDIGSDFWGVSQSTYFSAALWGTGLSLDILNTEDMIASEIIQFASIPEWSFNHYAGRNILERGDGSYFGYIHSGYAFGGSRTAPKKFYSGVTRTNTAEDCSSWLSKITGCSFPYTTLDLLYFHRHKNGSLHDDWIRNPEYPAMDSLYEVVNIETDLTQGDIIFWRSGYGKSENRTESIGKSGHCGIVSGEQRDGMVEVLSCAREMPEMEGFCYKSFPVAAEDKLVLALREKDSADLHLDARVSDVVGEEYYSSEFLYNRIVEILGEEVYHSPDYSDHK